MLGGLKSFVLIVLIGSTAAQTQAVPATDAAKHFGELATICGTISGEHYAASLPGAPTFINFERP
jgi:hypothetical protein